MQEILSPADKVGPGQSRPIDASRSDGRRCMMQAVTTHELDELRLRLQQEGAGRVQEVRLERGEDGVIVHCRSRNYYGLQVILSTLNEFARSDHNHSRLRLRAEVHGQHFDLPIERSGSMSTGKPAVRHSTMSSEPRTVTEQRTDRKIVVTETDLRRLSQMLDSEFAATVVPSRYLNDLRGELERAEVVPSEDVPDDVVTMDSTIILRDLDTGEPETFTLVYPQKANIAENKLSVLAPVGTAILGFRVGDVVRWKVPDGYRRLQIEEVLYQPERAGVLQS
jgi:regulator of nucleoside diphosphate kinase